MQTCQIAPKKEKIYTKAEIDANKTQKSAGTKMNKCFIWYDLSEII